MRRTILVLAAVALLLAMSTSAATAKDGIPSGTVLWHASPLACDAALGPVPAGLVDWYIVPGPGPSPVAGWMTPHDAQGPWVMVQMLWFSYEVYALNPDGSQGDLLEAYYRAFGNKTGLSGTTCHASDSTPGGPIIFLAAEFAVVRIP